MEKLRKRVIEWLLALLVYANIAPVCLLLLFCLHPQIQFEVWRYLVVIALGVILGVFIAYKFLSAIQDEMEAEDAKSGLCS